ncbi:MULTISPECIES: hypothetical protein [Cellulophaga]|jgi:uncharacterized membrane protein|uniref:Uncharacterized protein n=2 Tax=Cellulophaga baltica TaxID=76594 RepID=A0A1G7DID2_9FLAO|nr:MULTISPECIES: hypothetical protein [Cellulophaga]WFO14834.1 hypothetical protein M601_012990 [Cellulophaga baltica 4]AIY12811.1 membrane protein [Cellulophaga baltica NN016038]AIZ41167.1 membrane protein [Cellulophaga baltica 18]KGK32196.1 membrane protein [Cellulophaga sp. E6(2014)]MBA6313663.1 hypothetical protein [Cellulophaga baltica]
MTKIVSIVLIVIAVALIVYNATVIDFNNPLQGDSVIALIGIVAALCAIVLIVIFMMSKKIQQKVEGN